MSIDFHHPDYKDNYEKWELVEHMCESSDLEDYIVKLNPMDTSSENMTRNKQFLRRAVFYAIAGYTSRGLVGRMFSKWPKCELPAELEYMKKNIDGSGNSIYQQSQDVAKSVVRGGRSFLMVDFTATGGQSSRADVLAGRVRANVLHYGAEDVINWDTRAIDGEILLSLIVLKSSRKVYKDKYSFESEDIRIEMFLDEAGEYAIQKWRKSEELKGEWVVYEPPVYPLDSAGRKWKRIPGIFVGSESNTPTVDHPPMYDICLINKGHFNNSALYEDSVFFNGQPQPWASGLSTDDAVAFREAGIYFGSGTLIPVPAGETLGIAQAAPNTLAREAMRDKVDMSIGLGAMFIQPGSAVKTATQSEGEQKTAHSVLSLIASNISEAYAQVIEWACVFMGAQFNPDLHLYEINRNYVDTSNNPQMLQQIVAGFLQGVIPMSDYLSYMQKIEVVSDETRLEDFADEVSAVRGVAAGGIQSV